MKQFAPAFAMLIIAASNAAAEEINLSGTWNFTANLRTACTFHGQAHLSKSQDTGESDYACELTARQECDTGYEASVRQTCRVRNTRGQVWIRSTIEEFVHGAQNGHYEPDHFSLSVQSSSEMIGILTNRHGARPATWTREEGSVS